MMFATVEVGQMAGNLSYKYETIHDNESHRYQAKSDSRHVIDHAMKPFADRCYISTETQECMELLFT